MDAQHSSTVVAGYRIDGTLGEGGMGTVYRATQLSLERVVALKVLTAELSSDPGFRERFRREGLLQAALDHPHIVTVYEAGETDSRLFLAMRMVEGPTLKDLIQRRQLDDRRALRLLTQVAEALDAAHDKGLIHRDVKPQNVLVGAGDHAYLADFGLTKAHDDAAMTETGQFVGTIDYISPEQARGDHGTAASDVYALTAVLCECLTGQVPYVRATEERVLMAHLTEPPPRLSEVRADLPAAMDEVIAKGMAKDPADRPASAGELMLEARRALGAAPEGPAAQASTDTTRLRPTGGTATHVPRPGAKGDPGATRLVAAAATSPAAARAPDDAQAGSVRPADSGARSSAGAGRGGFVAALVAAAVLAAAFGFLLGGSSGGSGEAFRRLGIGGLRRARLPRQLAALAKRARDHGVRVLTAARARAEPIRRQRRGRPAPGRRRGPRLRTLAAARRVRRRPERGPAQTGTGAAGRAAGVPLQRPVGARPRRGADALRDPDRERRGHDRLPELLRCRRRRSAPRSRPR